MTSMDDLSAFVRQQLDAQAERARKLLVAAQQTSLMLKDPRHLGRFIPGWHDWPDVEQACNELLAEVEAKRRILRTHSRRHDCAYIEGTDLHGPCSTVVFMAQPYASQPGWQEAWRA